MEYVLLKQLNFKQEAQRVQTPNLPALYTVETELKVLEIGTMSQVVSCI